VRRPKAILFDIGETLIHFAGLHWAQLFRQGAQDGYARLAAHRLPLPPERQFVQSLLWRGRKAILLNRVSRRELDIADLFAMAIGGMRAAAKDDARSAKLEGPGRMSEFILALYEPLAQASTLDEQARPVLSRLRKEGFIIGLISNTFVPDYAMDRHLDRLAMLDLFDFRFYSAQFGLKKPSLTFFRHAVQSIGVSPRDAWHVGNDLIADVLGARRCGLTAVLRLPPGKRVRWWWLIKPHLAIHQLSDILPLLGL
jgi:HAD superfamily hydrolase (TIGR01509 family)